MTNTTPSLKSTTALKEEEILAFWNERGIFQKSLEKESPKGEYVFFDGPPFATGTPHYGHILASAIKDAVPRFWTMNGYHVERKWGWDCHGLPIENIVEKDLGISGKKQIEEIGLEKFNEHARSKVLGFAHEWKKTISRMARWVNFDGSYKTMDNSYIESVWWGLKQLHDKNKIYESVKVLMYCPRCETPLSNAEVAMDNSYKDIADISAYVKFKLVGQENTYIIAWTTTPWTLPGNTALAVGGEIEYIKFKILNSKNESQNLKFDTNDFYIIAKSRADIFLKEYTYEIVEEFLGNELAGQSYEPLFNYFSSKHVPNKENGWKIYLGGFVTTTDGTGVVHIAPAFGEDDLKLAKVHNVPIIHHVNSRGEFTSDVVDFSGFVKPKGDHQKTDIEIIKWLAYNGKLFAKEKINHSYPHCYRCETPLYYYAIPAWFIEIQSSKDSFLKTNQDISWVPSHLQNGRFKHVVENAPDWNISRNRFWASPLPFWKSETGNKVEVIGSLQELKEKTRSTNTYFLMRHGEGEHNIGNILSSHPDNPHHLTEKGKEQVRLSAELLKQENITTIIASPFLRTQETAKIVAETLGLDPSGIITDNRLRELDFGEFNLKDISAYENYYSSFSERLSKKMPQGESFNDMRVRSGQFLYDIDARYKNQNILVVTHDGPAWAIYCASIGASEKEAQELWETKEDFLNTGSFRKLCFARVPHNALYELDLHRPYIDAVTYVNREGEVMRRIPEVIDCWFESASMPYASVAYPFHNKDFFQKHFPADFIAEYIAQTRTWFYYTHAVSNMLFGTKAFKNVVTTGTVLAEDGQKMSKSKGNYPDPWIMFDKYGADAIRFYLLSSPLMRSEDVNFSEREVDEIHKKIILRMRNIKSFYEMYADVKVEPSDKSSHVLDVWIRIRLHETLNLVTDGMKKYEIDRALKPLGQFVDDLSTWYLRRSRDRVKGPEKEQTLGTLVYVMKVFSQMIAPVMPYLAEDLYRAVRRDTDPESVHLSSWPQRGYLQKILSRISSKETRSIEWMKQVRDIASAGLLKRNEVGIKVRQPLAALYVKEPYAWLSHVAYTDVLKDELNVKTISIKQELSSLCELDTVITPELYDEGLLRELVRGIQEERKNKNLAPSDAPMLYLYSNDDSMRERLLRWKNLIPEYLIASDIKVEVKEGVDISVGDVVVRVCLR